MGHSLTIKDNIQILLRCTNVNSYIVAHLRAGDGLTEDQESRIIDVNSCRSLRDRCTMLYDWMKEDVKLYDCFLQVMEDNEQQHVANLLKGNLKEPHVPLAEALCTRLVGIRPNLMRTIHYSEELLSNLESKGALSMTDFQDIREGKPMKYEKNFTLIQAIQRRSNYSFECLEKALRETHQEHIADSLTEGLIVPVHVNTNSPDIEKQLSDFINETVTDFPSDDSGILDLVKQGVHLVAARPHRSILIYLYCKTADRVVNFTNLYNSGRLTNILKDFFNRLQRSKMTEEAQISRKELDISLSLDEEDVLLIEEFSGLFGWTPTKTCKIEPDDKTDIEYKHDIKEATHDDSGSPLIKTCKIEPNDQTDIEYKHETKAAAHDDSDRDKEKLMQERLRMMEDLENEREYKKKCLAESLMKDIERNLQIEQNCKLKLRTEHMLKLIEMELELEKKFEMKKRMDSMMSLIDRRFELQKEMDIERLPDSWMEQIAEKEKSTKDRELHTNQVQLDRMDLGLKRKLELQNAWSGKFETDYFKKFRNTEAKDERYFDTYKFEVAKPKQRFDKERTAATELHVSGESKRHVFTDSNYSLAANVDGNKLLREMHWPPLSPAVSKYKAEELLSRKWSSALGQSETLSKIFSSEPNYSLSQGIGDFHQNPKLLAAVELKQSKLIDQRKCAEGLTILNDIIYVIYSGSSKMELYDCPIYKYKSYVEIKDMRNPKDIASCHLSKLLFVLDESIDMKGGQILKISASESEVELITSWLVPEGISNRLSVINGNIVLALFIDDNREIREFESNGEEIKRVLVDDGASKLEPLPGLSHPLWQALQTKSGQYICIVGHSPNCQEEVQLINREGALVKRSQIDEIKPPFISPEGPTLHNSDSVTTLFLAMDTKGNAIIADKTMNRILFFDSNLEGGRELISAARGLMNPTYVYYHELSGRLYVIFAERKLQVFQFS